MTLHVIGIDPGTLCGIARLEVPTLAGGAFGAPRIVSLNTITLDDSAADNITRLSVILRTIPRGSEVVGGIEIPFVSNTGIGGQSKILQGRHVGQIEGLLASCCLIRVYDIAPATAKKALTGHGRAGVKAKLGDRPGDARARGKASMMEFARKVDGWQSASLAIPSTLPHLQAAADAVGIALAAFGKFREDLLMKRVTK